MDVSEDLDGREAARYASERFFDTVAEQLTAARGANADTLQRAAEIVASTVAGDGLIFTFGSGHSQLLALEAAGRAGGFAGVQVILDPGFGRSEQLEGYGTTLLRDVAWSRRDCLIVISHSGRNPAAIEVALAGRASGLRVVAITALDYSRASRSRHSSGRRLFEAADVVLDTHGVPGDATVAIEGVEVRTGPTSTIVGAALLNAVMVAAVAVLARSGVEPPLVRSYNLEGSEANNDRVQARYRGRVTNAI
jgi:uncharacterized phosphosugar-binding protein